MILRESSLRITLVLILGLAVSEAQNARSYDTSDWIPITKPKQGDQEAPAAEKRATGRVLNLAETPAGKSFFPEDDGRNARQAGSDQQYLKETTQYKAPQQKNVEITQAQLQQYYVTQGPLQSYPQATLLKQNYPNLPVPQQYLLQQQPHQYLLPQTKANNATVYNPLGIGVQTINHELLGGRDNAYKQIDLTSTTPKAENQNVQLLYVPVEQLQNKQHRSNSGASPTYNDQRKQQQLVNIEKDFIQQALEAHKLQQQLQAYPSYTLPFYTSTLPPTTLKPVSRKRRPHQPPLAVYMNGNKDAEVFDVLNVLKNAKSIEVQDAVSPNSPEIFVGPATLDPPDGYAKFDLPYLSNLDSNRVERKVDQLPFFVAPLNYKTPPGYSKIPLPSPHVGSVVVSTKHAVEKPEFTVILDDPHQNFDQYNIRTTAAPAPPANVQFAQNLYNSEYQPLGNLDTTTQYYVSRRQPTRSKAKTHQRGRTEPTPQRPEVQDAFAEIHQHRDRLEVTPQDAYTAVHQHRGRIEPTPQDAYAGIHQHRGRIEPAPQDAYADLHQHRGRIEATQKPQVQLQDGSTEIQQYRGRIGPNQKPQNAYAEIHHPRGSVDPTHKPEVQLQNAYAEIPHPRGNIDLPQKPEVQLQKAYAEIHDVPQINTSPPPSGNDQVYPGASPTPQIRQKQQTSPHNFYPQQYEQAFSSTPLPKPKNFYAEPQVSSAPVLRPQPEYPADTQPRIEDILSIIPPPPSNPNSQEQQQQQQQNKHNGFDLGEVYPQFLAAQKPVDDYQKFDQLFQTAFLPNPNLNQVENNTPDQAKATPKPSEATREQTEEGKYTVLEEFSLSQPKTTTPGGTKQKPAEETRSADYVDETYRGKPHQQEAQSQPLQDYYEQENYQVQLHQGNPVLPGLINELQDQSVRQLLAPALLAPTTTEKATEKLVQEYHTQNPIGRPDYDYAYQALTTTQAPPVTTEAPQIETTSIKRTRGRGNSRFNLRTSTTSTPRRNAHRARTQQPSRSRYTTTHPPITSQINAERSPTRQRFRTKGRPLLKNGDGNSEITTSPLPQLPQPNPYYELDQAKPQFVAKSKELSPEEEYLIKKYNLAYSVANENQDIPNSKTEVTTYPPPQIAPVYIQTTQPTNYHRTTEQNRVRGRFRSKSKAAQYTTTTTPTTTPIPTTTVVLTTTPQVEVKGGSDNEEFYGFIRKPNYRGAEPNYSGVELNYRGAEPNYNEAEQNYREPQASYREPLYSPSYVSSTIQPPANRVPHDDDKPADVVIQNPVPVQFIGEIRPKFHSTTTTTTEAPITTTARYYISTTTTPAPKKRIRGRIRVPSRPRVTSSFSSSAETTTHSSSGEVQTEFEEITTTRRSVAQRIRGRGRGQFRLPEALSKAKTGDEDVEGGNYPRPFTKPTSTEKQLFQIAIDPAYEEDDQIPYASIHRPKIVAPNDIPVEVDKIPTTTAIAGDVEATTLPQAVEEVRKRGYWKLVKQKPVDEFEAAESQNVGVVSANSVVDDDKSSKTKPETSTQDFFDSIYQMFGLTAEKVENATVDNLATTNSTTVQSEEEEFTMETTPLLPSTDEAEDVSDASVADVSVKTSTSTEISHETEICYKGVCVKSKDKD